MASADRTAVRAGLAPELTVAIRSSGELETERIERTLAAAGCVVEPGADGASDVVVSVHRRAAGAACAELRQLGGEAGDAVRVLVIEWAGAGDVRRALQAGAQAVVTEALVETALLPSIEAARAGQIAIPAQTGARGAPRLLTTREKQILGMVVMGMSNAEIATQLFLAESTVKSHLSSAFSKLGVSSRSEAATVILDPNTGAGLGILTIPRD